MRNLWTFLALLSVILASSFMVPSRPMSEESYRVTSPIQFNTDTGQMASSADYRF